LHCIINLPGWLHLHFLDFFPHVFRFSSKLLAADKAAKVQSIVDAVRAGLMIVIAFAFLGVGFW
jgi:hypothetical protein